ncbi:hypothetical protein [Vibrio sp. CAU 1672]|uniref:hypothetical protein n=1 Tax=Vibrio sp. CAU 1672 TaxID=3032594 RepID=UPI0023DBE415|nr:hypothetical protein [Vibrio sp. CAU 1672]MDF2154616.1 hypothetical protein [Vibrio sp. CAU 1672]
MRLLISYFIYGLLTLGLLAQGALAAPLQFELQEHNLGTVTEKTWPDKYLLIGVGYTSCPDRELIDVFGYGEGGLKIGQSLQRYLNE